MLFHILSRNVEMLSFSIQLSYKGGMEADLHKKCDLIKVRTWCVRKTMLFILMVLMQRSFVNIDKPVQSFRECRVLPLDRKGGNYTLPDMQFSFSVRTQIYLLSYLQFSSFLCIFVGPEKKGANVFLFKERST